VRRAVAIVALALLAACYAELDWREVTSPEGRFAVLLPGKPTRDVRTIMLAGAAVKMHMYAVQVAGMAFGVGYADLPQDVDAAQALIEGRDALVRNIAGQISREQDAEAQGVRGLEFEATGTSDGAPMRLAARIFADGGRFYQVVLIGRAEPAARVDTALYLGSFKLLGPPTPLPIKLNHLRQNAGMKSTINVKSSSRPSSIVTVHTQVWKSVRLA
jgi:hypothetical protein